MRTYLAILLVGASMIASAAPFQNLGFDNGDATKITIVQGSNSGVGRPADLLPGWTVLSNGQEVPLMAFNVEPFGFPMIFGDAVLLPPGNSAGLPVIGDYSLRLTPVIGGTMSIVQFGDVPLESKSIRFLTFFDSNPFNRAPNDLSNAIGLTINGSPIGLQFERAAQSSFAVAGDVSVFAGQEVELAITARTSLGFFGYIEVYGLDSIAFSPLSVPEPSCGTLLSAALTFILVRQWLRRTLAIKALPRVRS